MPAADRLASDPPRNTSTTTGTSVSGAAVRSTAVPVDAGVHEYHTERYTGSAVTTGSPGSVLAPFKDVSVLELSGASNALSAYWS